MTCRAAAADDIAAITALWSEGMAVHANIDPRFPLANDAEYKFATYLNDTLANRDAMVFVAQSGSRVLGYCLARLALHPSVFKRPQYGYINDLFVASSHRRKGIGKALFEATAAGLRQRGIQDLEVSVVPANAMASGFWRKLGFKQRLETLRLESGTQT